MGAGPGLGWWPGQRSARQACLGGRGPCSLAGPERGGPEQTKPGPLSHLAQGWALDRACRPERANSWGQTSPSPGPP